MLKLVPLLLSFCAFALTDININISKLEKPSLARFSTHKNALAMNIPYSEILKARSLIESSISKKLSFYKGWVMTGEAHVTVITPPEFDELKKYVNMAQINQIARENYIQKSDLQVLGIGSAKKDNSETFFIIVNSENLRKIRYKIYELYKEKSLNKGGFDPYWYFPHITIGFTQKDLHESDGVIKSLKKTMDKRFRLK